MWFAIAYAAMQVGKTVFLWLSTPPSRSLARMNAVRITTWLTTVGRVLDRRRLCAGPIAAGALGDRAGHRIYFAGGTVLDTALWRVFGRGLGGRRRPHGRALRGFIIIALGESIVVTGATFADLTWTAENVAAFVSAFVGSLAMWWIYFHKGAEPAPNRFQGRASRDGWRGSPIPICTCRSWPASSSRRWPTNWC